MTTITLRERMVAYDTANYTAWQRLWRRARIVMLWASCWVGLHHRMVGYSGRVWCWMCGRRLD